MNYVIGGPPGSGKTTFVNERLMRGDLIVDVDTIWQALSGQAMYDKPNDLLRYVLAARDAVISALQNTAAAGNAYVITACGERRTLEALAKRLGAELIVLEVDSATCKSRLDADPRRDGDTDWHGMVDAWWSAYNANGRGVAMNGEIERRIVDRPVEIRQRDGRTVIEGYAALYGVLSDDLGGFRELLLPGAFADRIGDDVRALWQHDPLYVFGRTVPGTLALAEDEIGLRYTVTPPDAQWARDALLSIARGDVSQSSFAFTVLPDGESWDLEEGGQVVRSIRRVARLYDVSPVTYAAYPQTSVSVQQRAADLRARATGAVNDKAIDDEARAHRVSAMGMYFDFVTEV